MNNNYLDEYTLLEAEYGNFDERSSSLFNWSIGLFAFSNTALFLIFILIPFDSKQYSKNKKLFPIMLSGIRQLREFLKLFIPRKGFYFTPIVFDLNIVVFLIMTLDGTSIITPNVSDIINWGGNLKQLTLNGEYWRVFTCLFVHIGIIHLCSNLVALQFAGILLEEVFGTWKISFIYFLSGITSSLSSLLINENVVSAGASGAIFGLYGLYFALILTKHPATDFSKAFLPIVVLFIVYNLILGLSGNIDNAAHIGGLVTGFMYGLLESFILTERKKSGNL
jgi:rhomboid protease GluP